MFGTGNLILWLWPRLHRRNSHAAQNSFLPALLFCLKQRRHASQEDSRSWKLSRRHLLACSSGLRIWDALHPERNYHHYAVISRSCLWSPHAAPPHSLPGSHVGCIRKDGGPTSPRPVFLMAISCCWFVSRGDLPIVERFGRETRSRGNLIFLGRHHRRPVFEARFASTNPAVDKFGIV
jgi:hypothetical protein